MYLWIKNSDGVFCFEKELAPILSIQSRMRYGDGVFDTAYIKDGHCVFQNHHFERLFRHADVLSISVEMTVEKFAETAEELIKKNKAQEGNFVLNTYIIRDGGHRLMPDLKSAPVVIMRMAPMPDHFASVHAIISQTVRRNEHSPLSKIKSCQYTDQILGLIEAEKTGANHALFLNTQGKVTCADIGNIIIARDGELLTPRLEDGVLDGIARGLLIEKFGVREVSLNPEDLQNADGLYICNSIRGLQPVRSLDGQSCPHHSLDIPEDFHLRA